MATTKSSKKSLPLIVIILLVIGVVIVAVGGYFLMNKGKMTGGSLMNGGNAFTSIKDALTKSVSLECEYTDSENVKSKYYIKNGAMRADVESSDPEQSGSMIMKDKMLYSWRGKEGFAMKLTDTEGDSEINSNEGESEMDTMMKDLEEYKDKCKPSVVSDSLFTPPSDVEFSDMSKMMEGAGTGAGMSAEELKEMMQQYQGSESTNSEDY